MSRTALRFEDEDVLLVALSAGWIPPEVAAAPAWVSRAEDSLIVAPSVAITDAALKALALKGVERCTLKGGNEVQAWAEAVALRRLASAGLDAGTVTFLLPRTEQIAGTAAEILRLGCDRQEVRVIGERALLRVIAPPFHALGRALDRVDGVRAYRQIADRVLVEIGYEHPLERRLRPREGSVLLLSPEGWELVADGPFEDLLAHVELSIAKEPKAHGKAAAIPRIVVPLKLSRAAKRAAPSLWLVAGDAVEEVERFVRSAPDEVIGRYLFAATDEPSPRVLLRRRPDARDAGEPSVRAEAFSAHPQIPHLFVPTDATIEPPLRHERLRALVAPDPSAVTWIAREGFAVERIADSAFQPLAELVDYLVDRAAPTLEAWVRSVTFDFESFVVDDARPVEREPAEKAPAKTGKKKKAPEPEPEPVRAPQARARAKEQPVANIEPVTLPTSEAAQALAATEAEFLASDAPADDPARTQLWVRLGQLNAALNRTREAAHGFVHAIWESRGEEARALGRAWAGAETAIDLPKVIARETPSSEEIRAVAAALVSLPDDAKIDFGQVARFLDRNDGALDVRTMWLARSGAAKRAGDKLMLARARDRALARLARGLSVERDVPTFLRFLGQSREAQSAERLSAELEGLLGRSAAAPRTRSAVEAKPEMTRAYVEHSIAYGLARLGSNDRARAIAREAQKKLDAKDPVHGFLVRAYGARIEQAIAGEGAHAALPAKIAAELNDLERFLRYKVDRLRQASQILEPLERLDPIGAFQRADADPRGDAFAPLRSLDNGDAIANALDGIVAKSLKETPENKARAFDAALDFLPQIPEPRAIAIAERVLANVADVPPLPRAQLYEEVLRVGGHFGEARLVRSSLDALEPLVRTFDDSNVEGLAQLLGGAVRALRRVGLREDAIGLLSSVSKIARGDSIPTVVAQVQVAGGLAVLGRDDEARPMFERALQKLAGEVTVPDRLVLTRAIARGVASMKQEFALAVLHKLEQQLPKITDSYNTNSHFCLSVVAFIESLVLGYVSEDLALGEMGRRFLDEDEHLVRRRIHREVRA
ncbi:MAG: hypothetical protein ACXVEE_37065 [Polyangiales bacterium]